MRFLTLLFVVLLASALACATPASTSGGPSKAQVLLGAAGEGDKAAFDQLHLMAEHGDADAQVNLAILYLGGYGIKQNFSEYSKWAKKAAEQGSPQGEYLLAGAYGAPYGLKKDFVESAKWFRKAADQGHPQSQYNLGQMYAEGQGVDKNYSEAYFWMKLGVANNAKEFAPRLDFVSSKLTPQEIAKIESRISEWKPQPGPCFEEKAIEVAKSDPRLKFCTQRKYGCTYEAHHPKDEWYVTVTPLDKKGVKILALGSDDTVVVSDDCKISGFHYGR